MEIPEEEERQKGTEVLEQKGLQIFPQINVRIWTTEPERSENIKHDNFFKRKEKQNKKLYLYIIIFKLQKIKGEEQFLKDARRKKHLIHSKSKNDIQLLLRNPSRTEWSEAFKALRGKKHQPQLLYPAKLSFKSEREIKILKQTNWGHLFPELFGWKMLTDLFKEKKNSMSETQIYINKSRTLKNNKNFYF